MESIDVAQTRALSGEEVQAAAIEQLGLDPTLLDLQSPEALAALVRRAASFSAPCAPRSLREHVVGSLRGLFRSNCSDCSDLRQSVDEVVERLTSYGDLLDLTITDPNYDYTGRSLYLAPPTFVCVDMAVFLLGGALDGADPVPSDLRPSIEYRSHTRRICCENTADIARRLKGFGWIELGSEFWLSAPSRETAAQLVDRANVALATKPTGGDVEGLTILDTDKPVLYYPGRWVEPTRKTGRFVARRDQRYGADLWSYVELADGAITHLIDLPLSEEFRAGIRSCDAAWHLQMALDNRAGHPQFYRLRLAPPAGSIVVDLFSPVPLWARRRWDVLGEEVSRSGSLFAYRFPLNVAPDVEQTLQSDLWLAERP